MKVTKVMISYDEKRSQGYQSVGHSISVEVELADGEKTIDAIRKYQPILRDQVSAFCAFEIERIAPSVGGAGYAH